MDSIIKENFNFQQNTAGELCCAFLLSWPVRPCRAGEVR